MLRRLNTMLSFWLRSEDGSRIPVGSGGVLLGRAPDSDIVLTDEEASRRHALVHVAGRTLRVLPLGKGRTEVDGTAVRAQEKLAAGQRIYVPGLTLTVESAPADPAQPVQRWVLQRVGSTGSVYGVSQTPYRVGGGADDLCIAGWPAGAMVFHRIGDNVSVEAGTPLRIDGVDVPAGQIEPCRSGTIIELATQALRVLVASEAHGLRSTAGAPGAAQSIFPHRVKLSFLPRGARLHVEDASGAHLVYLPERRAELTALLLSPPSPHAPGAPIPDDVVLTRLWPRQAKTNNDIHVLVHRLRKSLVGAGLDGTRLILRDPRTGGTWFAVADGAEIAVE